MSEDRPGDRQPDAGAGAEQRIVVEVGNEYFPPGRTRVELQSDGRVLATNRLEGKEEREAGQVDPAVATRLIDVAGSDRVQRLKTSGRRGIPDEPRYLIQVDRGPERIVTLELWRSELEEQPELARLIAELERIAQENTGGRVAL